MMSHQVAWRRAFSAKAGPSNAQVKLMAAARAATSFDVDKLAAVIHGDAETVQSRREAWARVEDQNGDADTSKVPARYAFTSREYLYWDGLRMGRVTWDDRRTHNHEHFDWLTQRYTFMNNSPFGLSTSMFTKILQRTATPEQQKDLLKQVAEGQINGAYIQTELAHGTFVRGIQTTATFDEEKDIFVINTPNLAATKFWPGALGYSASHGVVMARLIIRDKDYGMHPFLLQLRDLKTGKPYKGIEIGDVGLKMSHNQNDNGYGVFTNVEIPRTNMLMAQSSVSRDGTYTKNESVHPKALYGTMMITRSKMVWVSAIQLAAVLTIAIRYSTVRVQGRLPYDTAVNDGEIPVMTFQSQHYRLLSHLSRSYAMLFASKYCANAHEEFERLSDKGDFSTMPLVHSLAAGMKAWATTLLAVSADDARRTCGGQGYLIVSGLPELVLSSTAMPSLEGENHVLWQQSARLLMKWAPVIFDASSTSKAQIPEDLQYLTQPYTQNCAEVTDFNNPADQLSIFEHRSQRLLKTAIDKVNSAMTQGQSKSEAWNKYMMVINDAAEAHAEYLALREFAKAVSKIENASIAVPLDRLRSLFALTAITNSQLSNAMAFVEDGYLSEQQLDTIRDTITVLLEQLLPDAIGLTDAWDFTDAGLGSALGMKDGNANETLMGWIRQLPFNKEARDNGGVFRTAWEDYIAPR